METDFYYNLVKMVGTLALVLGLMFVLFYFARRTILKGQGIMGGGKVIKVVAQQSIAPKRSLAVVNVAGEYLVLGIGAEQISLLDKIENPASIETMLQSEISNSKQPFSGVLDNLMNTVNREKKNRGMKSTNSHRHLVSLVLLLVILLPSFSWAQTLPIPTIQIGVGQADNPSDVSTGLQILFLLTFLSLAPALLVLVTSFTRIVVVFSFLRHALGTQQMPPNQVLIGLALFLTIFIMAPVWQEVNKSALQPYINEEIGYKEALDLAETPVRKFMLSQTREKDIAVFYEITEEPRPKTEADVPTHLLIPAFVISELRTAFQIGFLIYIPFLVLDMVVASVLLSMGMMMLPPVMISLPFKLLLFVLVDGWNLMIGSLVKSFY